MSFPILYRVSFYVMLVCATLVLNVEVTDIRYALVYPFAVAVAAVAAFLTVDRNPRLALSDLSLNALALLSGLRVTLTTLALGGVIFLAMPRRTSASRQRGVDTSSQHLTGFDDEVQLGQMGEILENDTVVMSVEFYDEQGGRIAPDGEPLW